MEVTVLLFGPQANLVGERSLAIKTATDTPNAADVLAALAAMAPALADSLSASELAVNHEFAAPERLIGPNDEVALIGMVSGG